MQQLNITRRNLPHWRMDGAVYFITFRTKGTLFSNSEISLVLNHIKSGIDKFYRLYAATVLPDHVHLLIQSETGIALSRIMHGIKGKSARLINTQRGSKGIVWQDESYDRIVRDEAEFREKLNYIIENAFRKGLTDAPMTYPGLYINPA